MVTFLFVLRILSALSLLTFMGLLAWLIYRDTRVTAETLSDQTRPRGILEVTQTESLHLEVGSELALLPVTAIGRAASSTIVIDDEYASGEHILITLRGQQWWIEDLNSSNGTLLNGQLLVQPTVLSAGDVIEIGTTLLRVVL